MFLLEKLLHYMTIQNLIKHIKIVSSTTIHSLKKTNLQMFASFLVLALLSIGSLSGQKTWDRGANTNNWEDGNNWNPNGIPLASETATIGNNFTVVINSAAVCSSLTISNGNRPTSVTINGTNSLTVTNAVTIGAAERDNDNKFISVGIGTLTAASVTMANTTNDTRDCNIRVSTGNINILGNISMGGSAARNQIVFSDAGTLNVGGTISGGTISNTAGSAVALTRGTVNYNGGIQTVLGQAYNNLTLSGTGAKTTTGVTVNGIMSIEGNATVTVSAAITYGTNSTLQYKGTATRTSTNNEFPNNFNGTGGLIIDQGAGISVVLNANKTALTLINIKSGNLDKYIYGK